MRGVALIPTAAQSSPLADQPPYVVALLVLGVLLVIASMFIGLRNRKKSGTQHVTAREQLERVKQREGLKRDLEGLAVEIEEMARRVGAQLDNKAARLETLLDQADAAAHRLEQARLAMLNPAASLSSEAATSHEDHSGGSLAKPTAGSKGVGADSFEAGNGKPSGDGGGGGAERLSFDVIRLHAQGMSAAEIARAVGEDSGKIELILALQNAKA